MKRSLMIFVLIIMTAFAGEIKAQSQSEKVASGISKLIRENNMIKLSSYFHDPVDLNIGGKKGIYSKQQSVVMIKDFFTTYPVSSFKINHTGSSQKKMVYSIGTYQSKQIVFRTYFLFKKENGNYKIYQFHFEKEK